MMSVIQMKKITVSSRCAIATDVRKKSAPVMYFIQIPALNYFQHSVLKVEPSY